jgi:flagellar biosynthesis component FlhA
MLLRNAIRENAEALLMEINVTDNQCWIAAAVWVNQNLRENAEVMGYTVGRSQHCI